MNKEQELIDIMFELVGAMYSYPNRFSSLTREEHMQWVADQLRKCGFDTQPMGMSWGVLKNGR